MNEKVYKEAEGMNDMTENEMEFRIQSELRMCLKTFIMVYSHCVQQRISILQD